MNPLAPTTYGFSNTKVAALKSKMLTARFYREALSVKGLPALVELLRDSAYSKFVEGAESSKDLERGMARRLVYHARLLKKYLPEKDFLAYDTFLKRYEFIDLKIIVSAVAKNHPKEKVLPKLYGVTAPLSFWESALEDKSILYRLIGKKTVTIENIPKIIEEIDRRFVESQKILKNSKSYRFIVKDVDINNLLKLLSAKGRASFKMYGSISKQRLEEAKKSDKQRKALLASYGISAEDSVPEAQMKAEMFLARKKKALFHTTSFSLDKVLLFLLMLEEEIRNVRKIALSKELGIPFEKVEEVLVQ